MPLPLEMLQWETMQGSLFKTTCMSRQFEYLEQICGGEANNKCYRMCPRMFNASHHSEPLAAMHSFAKNSQEYRSNRHPRNVTPDPIELLAPCRLVGQCRKKVTGLFIFYHILSSFKRKHHRSQHEVYLKKESRVLRSKTVMIKQNFQTKIHQERKSNNSQNCAPFPKVETKPNEIVPLPVSMSNHTASLRKNCDFL